MALSSAASPRRYTATPFLRKGDPESRGYGARLRPYFELPKLYTRLVVNRLSMCLVPGTMLEL
jgi:hypothetical protein